MPNLQAFFYWLATQRIQRLYLATLILLLVVLTGWFLGLHSHLEQIIDQKETYINTQLAQQEQRHAIAKTVSQAEKRRKELAERYDSVVHDIKKAAAGAALLPVLVATVQGCKATLKSCTVDRVPGLSTTQAHISFQAAPEGVLQFFTQLGLKGLPLNVSSLNLVAEASGRYAVQASFQLLAIPATLP